MSEEKARPPIKSGWRGNLNGAVEHTEGSGIAVSEVTVRLDKTTAWALCNVLTDRALDSLKGYTEDSQRTSLATLGAALGRLIDHHAANNGGRECVK